MLESTARFREEIGGDREVDRCRLWLHMPKKRREVEQARGGIDACPIPAQQGAHGTGVAEVMHAGGRCVCRDHHVEVGTEITKHTVDSVPIQPAAAPDGKERRVGAERRAPVAA